MQLATTLKPKMVTTTFPSNRNSIAFSLGLLAAAGLQVFLTTCAFGFSLNQAALDAAVSWLLLGIVIYLIVNTLSFFHPSRGKFLVVILPPAVLAYVWLFLTSIIVSKVNDSVDYSEFLDYSEFYRISVAFLIFAGASLFGLLSFRLRGMEAEQNRKLETEKIAREAELFKLRQQLQPHFLFNSLNSVNSLIGRQPEKARRMVQQLSDFLRGTMRREDQKLISLKEEMEYLKLYLEIEQVRFGHRLKVEMDCGEHLLSQKLPLLILQPLLENAIKFGLYGITENVLIKLACKSGENALQITIENPYDSDENPSAGTGFGLTSVKRRLYLLFGRTDLIETKSIENQFIVRLKIPNIND